MIPNPAYTRALESCDDIVERANKVVDQLCDLTRNTQELNQIVEKLLEPVK